MSHNLENQKPLSKQKVAIITTATPFLWQWPDKHSKNVHVHLHCPEKELVAQKRQEKMCSIHSTSQWRVDYENTLIHIELHSFSTNLRICPVVEEKKKPMIEWLKWWRKKRAVLILAVFEKAELNTFRKNSSKQKSRAVISTSNNLFTRETKSSVWKPVANAWKQFEGSLVGKWMKFQYIREKLLRKSQKKYAKGPKHLWNTKCCAIS